MSISKYRQSGVEVPYKTRREVRHTAHYVRDISKEKYGFAEACFPIVRLIETWGSMPEWKCPNYIVLEDDMLPTCSASFHPDMQTYFVRETVWDLAWDDDPESRETLAHETGHCVLKHPYVGLQRASLEFHNVVPETDSEHQANWFMCELLMDSRLITSTDTVGTLIDKFNVTEELARFRIFELMAERNKNRWNNTKI